MEKTYYSPALLTRNQTIANLPTHMSKEKKLAQFLAQAMIPKYIVDSNGKLVGLNPDKKSDTPVQSIPSTLIEKRLFDLELKADDKGTVDLSKQDITEGWIDSTKNYTQIKNLNLSYNFIPQLVWAAFWGLDNLVTLDLSHNKITKIEENAFKELEKLETLNLSYNKLSHIDSDAFINLKQLKTLIIHNNLLEKINLHAFKKLGHVTTINISFNKLNELNKKLLRLLLLYTNITF
jgi:Leucine-rich repeat (LRR) protein